MEATMKMSERLERYGDLATLDPESRRAALVRRQQAEAPRHPRPINLMPGIADPECVACEEDAVVCTLHDANWRLCPHAGPASRNVMQQPWPEPR